MSGRSVNFSTEDAYECLDPETIPEGDEEGDSGYNIGHALFVLGEIKEDLSDHYSVQKNIQEGADETRPMAVVEQSVCHLQLHNSHDRTYAASAGFMVASLQNQSR